MVLQDIIDLKTSIIEKANRIIEFENIVSNFTSIPRSKKEAMDFLQSVDIGDRKKHLSFSVSLTTSPSFFNSRRVNNLYVYNRGSIVDEAYKVLKNELDKLNPLMAEYIREIHDKLIELDYPDLNERIIALRKYLKKINIVLWDHNDLEITEEQIDNYEDFDSKGSYLTSSLDFLINDFLEFYKNRDICGNFGINYIIRVKNVHTAMNYITRLLTY